MKVFVCYSRDSKSEDFVAANQVAGNEVFEDGDSIFVNVLKDYRVWRAKDAIEQYVSSGTYRFDDKGRPYKVS